MKCIYRQCIDVDHWDICTCAIYFWKYIWCWPWVCLDGPLGNANLERKLNVKVRIKVVSIFSNCLEQRSMSFGHARDTLYFLQNNEAFLVDLEDSYMHILKIYLFLSFDKCCLHVEAGLHPRGTGNLQSSLCSKRLTMRIIMSFPLIFIIELFPFSACSLGGLYFVFLVGHVEYKTSRNSQ